MKNPPGAKLAVSDAKVLRVIKEQAGLKYSKRAADAKAVAAMEIARGMRKTIGEEGANDTDLAAWAWHVHERLSPVGGASRTFLHVEGANAGTDIASGSFAIKEAGEAGFGLDALDVGYMLRSNGLHEREGAAFLQGLYAHAAMINVVLGRNNMLEVARSWRRREDTRSESSDAREARAKVAREAEEYQRAEKEAELAEERRVRSLTTAPVQDWRKLLETDYTEVEGPTEVEEHLRHTGGIRGASLDTDREAVLEISRLLAKAGMSTAARQVKNEAKLPSASKLFDWADEAYRRSSNGTIKAGLEKWANMLVGGDEHSRERGHAFIGAKDIEHQDDNIIDEARRIADRLASKLHLTDDNIKRLSFEVTEESLRSAIRSIESYGWSRKDLAVERNRLAEIADILHDNYLKNLLYSKTPEADHSESSEIAARARLIEYNPQSSDEEKAIKREMETLESEKRQLFYQKRDEMHPIPPGTTGMYWYPEDVIKAVYKAIKPQEAVIDVRLRELRARKKALADEAKVAKAARKLEPRPARGPEKRQGRCHDCHQRYMWLERPNVKISGSYGATVWSNIECPKCGGYLSRTSADGATRADYIDLDATGGKTS